MRVPTSTYRLQLHAGFTIDDAATLVPTLDDLGVSHLYLSPILQAADGSPHGYDVVDPAAVDAERGGRPAFDRLRAACARHGMGLVLDVVPNHLCVTSPRNSWWASVLRLGPASPFAACFDLDWDSPHAGGRLILPVLSDELRQLAARGELALEHACGRLQVAWHEHRWPLRPGTAAAVLRGADPSAGLGLADVAARLDVIEQAAARTPPTGGADRVDVGPDGLEAACLELESALAERLAGDERARAALDRRLAALAEPEAMAAALEAQHYRPMPWRAGGRIVNYRRFFDVDGLAAVRADEPGVFEAAMGLTLELAGLDEVDGLRVDHPDGLRDPGAFLERLAARAPDAWIVAEKILAPDESLPEDWPVAGTTGYEHMNDALRLLLDPAAEGPLTDLHAELTGVPGPFHEIELASKRHAARALLGSDLERAARVTRQALEACDEAPEVDAVADVLAELAAGLPIYRTYGSARRPALAAAEWAALAAARDRVRTGRPDVDPELLEAVVAVLRDPDRTPPAREAADRFQQLSAPVAAKGVEDTAFYRYHPMPALAEVGGDPGRWSLGAEAFHDRVRRRAARWPHAMLAGTTHDAKRSEDVRARLAVLTVMHEAWGERLRAWHAACRGLGPEVDPLDVHLLLHVLVGAWPIGGERLRGYMTKAVRESKRRTSWREPDAAYEAAVTGLVDALLADEAVRSEVEAFVDRVRRPGRVASLVMATLRLAGPGVPDTYQGGEGWDHSLVDPDNRRPVDRPARARLAARVRDGVDAAALDASLDDPEDPGLARLWLVRTLLRLRRARPDVFAGDAAWHPLPLTGADADEAIAFARGPVDGPPTFLAVLPLRPPRVPRDARVELPAPRGPAWRDLASGARVEPGVTDVAALLRAVPVALLAAPDLALEAAP